MRVAAIEDADKAVVRYLFLDPPQEVVLALLLGRCFERGDRDASGVEQAGAVANDATFA
jgi:hypothetical protein